MKHSHALEKYLRNEFKGSIQIDIKEVETMNPVEALIECWHYIKRDFILLSCDLLSELPLDSILEFHSHRDSLVTAVFNEVEGKDSEEDANDFVAFNEENWRLLSLGNADEVKEESVKIRDSILAK